MDSKNLDALGLSSNAKVAAVLQKMGENSPRAEVVKYSCFITKINKRNKEQHRAILITDKAMYNLMPNYKCKRRISLRNIVSVTASCSSREFVVHVPNEYDYRYKSANKEEILDVLQVVFAEIKGNSHRQLVRYTPDEVLAGIAMTKADSKLLSREDRAVRQQQLLDLLGQKDKEEEEKEAKNQNREYEQLMESDQKVTLRDFQLKKVLGRGSFGKVMLVRKKDNGEYYAMKILKKEAVIQRNQIEHTKAERAILQQLQHPFLMTLRYAFQTSAKLYLVLDFYQGGELFYHLKNMRRFTERCAKIYVGEIALALGYLHSLEVIYRDLKPENILLDPEGHVCLTDFGLAKEVHDGDQTSSFCGTPEYLAPEIVGGLGHDKAVDWWSLGILLYELTVGIPPFYSQNINDMYNKIQHGVLRFPPFLSDNCKSLIVALLNRDPAERCGSHDDVEDIKEHPFYDDIDWDAMHRKEVVPDYQPQVKKDMAGLFDEEFTREKVQDTFVAPTTLVRDNEAQFDNFTFSQSKNIA